MSAPDLARASVSKKRAKEKAPRPNGRFAHRLIRFLDWLADKVSPQSNTGPEHLRTAMRGEDEAYFFLRRQGYVMVARNWRSPNHRGEIDLIGWDGDSLCFIEVKTRTSRAVKPAEAAVDDQKQHDLRAVARAYLRHLPPETLSRFDIISVYMEQGTRWPEFQLFRNAFPLHR